MATRSSSQGLASDAVGGGYTPKFKGWEAGLNAAHNRSIERADERYEKAQDNRYDAAGSEDEHMKSKSIANYAYNLAVDASKLNEKAENDYIRGDGSTDAIKGRVFKDALDQLLGSDLKDKDGPRTFDSERQTLMSAYRRSAGSATDEQVETAFNDEVLTVVQRFATQIDAVLKANKPSADAYQDFRGAVSASWDESFDNDYNEGVVQAALSIIEKTFKLTNAKLTGEAL